jgi:hypothetical protein
MDEADQGSSQQSTYDGSADQESQKQSMHQLIKNHNSNPSRDQLITTPSRSTHVGHLILAAEHTWIRCQESQNLSTQGSRGSGILAAVLYTQGLDDQKIQHQSTDGAADQEIQHQSIDEAADQESTTSPHMEQLINYSKNRTKMDQTILS